MTLNNSNDKSNLALDSLELYSADISSPNLIDTNDTSHTLTSQILSASLGALLTTVSMTPFDLLMTFLQTCQAPFPARSLALQIIKQEGFLKLWRGITPTLFLVVPQTVIYLVGYEKLRKECGNAALAGALSRGILLFMRGLGSS